MFEMKKEKESEFVQQMFESKAHNEVQYTKECLHFPSTKPFPIAHWTQALEPSLDEKAMN